MKRLLKVVVVAGARPNFMKVAPLLKALRRYRRIKTLLVHTGQHYDFRMSSVFFKELKIPKPDIFLNTKSGTHAHQTARVLSAFESVLLKEKPALVVVVGDVNSTLACALAASKLHIRVAHVEAGLRSFDRSMPEEVNRIVTDRLSDYWFVTEESGLSNLTREASPKPRIFFTGNVMIDTLLAALPAARRSDALKRFGLEAHRYAVATLHRPSNVDSKASLEKIARIFEKITPHTRLVFPVHPRTRAQLRRFGLEKKFLAIRGLVPVEPLGYIDFIALVKEALFVLTDSGGIQEEATVLKIPCLTMRENTERPSTILLGTNRLVGQKEIKILSGIRSIMSGKWPSGSRPKFWDGHAAERIARILVRVL